MNKPIYVLGSGLSHDGSACLMKNGKIIVGIEKERLTKIKHDGFNDNDAIRYCLNAAGITFKDVDLFVEKYTVNEKHKPDDVIKRRGRIIPEYLPIVRIGHHIAHAYSAVGTSPFSESAVIVCDGMGGSIDSCLDHDIRLVPSDIAKLSKSDYIDYFEKESYYKFFNNNVIPVFKDYSRFNFNDLNRYKIAPYDIEHSIGGLYGGASKFVFGNDFNEGKLMGLAPYGKSGRFSGELFLMKDARVKINYDLIENLGLKDTNIKDNFQYCADLAKWVQEQTEEALFYLLNEYYEMYSSDNLCYAGGLALNAVANGKITQNTPFKNVYIQPAAGDNGLAIGACYYGWMKVLNKEKVPFNGNPYFGIKYDTSESSLCKYLDDNYVITKPGNLEEVVAKHISEGKVVGCFRKGSEFGPRALGNRSILADPRRKEMLDYINIAIKNREEFRPFAPSILKDRYSDFFKPGNEDSDYMIKVSQVIPEKSEQIGAVVHVDGTARVQTVTRELNRNYYNLINEFYKLTDVPILLNTSFNGKDTPIVETPEDAINFYRESKLDFLIIDNYLIHRK
ncbi:MULTISPECIES: carbamoyltransferase family protein [Photorhabdus]|uniref:Carbamoyltransferase n=2 Tax=Photorhabdus asymbiotica TaxID=291112 RepID=C7BJF4_PHOAA|nr:carbamoyltransferase C-terminal domain-containing protein [Photorhabdus asymbiotica]RKS65889.1 carbamoyltransferase [Photorhabdus asymbiotica]CAQ84222.1 conserved hypothetical protein [Photorhabdus asymbiotica]